MNILLSLPPEAAAAYNETSGFGTVSFDPSDLYYFDSDPRGSRVGSAGGTVWIYERFRQAHPDADAPTVIVHAAGQSRRLPAYAAVGKSMTPVPVLRWAEGERIDRNLLDLQLPLLRRIMEEAPDNLKTLIVSGDALVWNESKLPAIPKADVVCFGIWVDPSLAKNHGVYCIPRDGEASGTLDFMLQKPSVEKLNEIRRTHYYLMDVGLWLLSDRAMDLLRKRSTGADGQIKSYDLYSEFGGALGRNPIADDPELAALSVAIVPLQHGQFYHFGTTRELLSSTLSLQNLVADQRRIMHRRAKPNPALFVQNCLMKKALNADNENIWIENSYIGEGWSLTKDNVITGVPENDWSIRFSPGQCLDIVPLNGGGYAVRPYGYDDKMRGDCGDEHTKYLGESFLKWLSDRNIGNDFSGIDIQSSRIFPVVRDIEEMGRVIHYMLNEPDLAEGGEVWEKSEKISADEIIERADLGALLESRRRFLKLNLEILAYNPDSVFYQLDLADTAIKFHEMGLSAPAVLPETDDDIRRARNLALRSRIESLDGIPYEEDLKKAFGIMREDILATIDNSASEPHLSVYNDQIVWGRSPVRIELAGGWTDTPPYCLLHGGTVANIAIELNGQPPLQVFVKPCKEPHIIIRSIDLGASETITDYATLTDFSRFGSPFALPKAALCVAGFAPRFSASRHASLEQQLRDFGSGIEITLLSAVPAGSGLGTSSILAATVLGALADFAGLSWTHDDICLRVLALEQLLTSGGGWQDQYGGVLRGVKLLQTEPGMLQAPRVNWLPDGIFTDPEFAPCHILYYTGITRAAKGILAGVVTNMFLNERSTMGLLSSMKEHTFEMADAIQRRDFKRYGELLTGDQLQKNALHAGSCPAAVQRIIDRVKDYTSGIKIPGAGGGGYLYFVAKDPEAAAIIKRKLDGGGTARLSEMRISDAGLRISRS